MCSMRSDDRYLETDIEEIDMKSATDRFVPSIVRLGVLGGLAGGFAEVAWIAAYGALAGVDTSDIARGIVDAVAGGSVAVGGSMGVAAGVLIHLFLAIALGVGLALAWHLLPVRCGAWSDYALAAAVLAMVWKVNFFLVLPLLSPSFVHMLPYSVTFVSKLAFGLAAATVLRLRGAQLRDAMELARRR